jgi:hypothetical protein
LAHSGSRRRQPQPLVGVCGYVLADSARTLQLATFPPAAAAAADGSGSASGSGADGGSGSVGGGCGSTVVTVPKQGSWFQLEWPRAAGGRGVLVELVGSAMLRGR